MKKFNKPEIELIVLDNADICTTSTPVLLDQEAVMLNYNGRGAQTLAVEELEDELE